MAIEIDNHPCFNDAARKNHGRVHLPVAPDCNIQCNFCSRKYDCVNESRPGVTSSILGPVQARRYLDHVMKERSNISVVGIAGPGDPFASPGLTMETLRLVRERYPEIILCVATNGLEIAPCIEELAGLRTSHVTVTVNAVDPEIGAKIYSWVRFKKRVYRNTEAAGILLENQLSAIGLLKKAGITVKVNSIIIPGINDQHIPQVAQAMKEMGVDILNCIPLYPAGDSLFAGIGEPDAALVADVRREAGRYIPQMRHCTRCRADAAGLLGEESGMGHHDLLNGYSVMGEIDRPCVAVASREGLLVNLHLGEAEEFLVFRYTDGRVENVGRRTAPPPGGGPARWRELAGILRDCGHLLVSGTGRSPREILEASGIRVIAVEGLIEDAVKALGSGGNIEQFIRRRTFSCGEECSGSAGGCG